MRTSFFSSCGPSLVRFLMKLDSIKLQFSSAVSGVMASLTTLSVVQGLHTANSSNYCHRSVSLKSLLMTVCLPSTASCTSCRWVNVYKAQCDHVPMRQSDHVAFLVTSNPFEPSFRERSQIGSAPSLLCAESPASWPRNSRLRDSFLEYASVLREPTTKALRQGGRTHAAPMRLDVGANASATSRSGEVVLVLAI